jgi:hypothetical protein
MFSLTKRTAPSIIRKCAPPTCRDLNPMAVTWFNAELQPVPVVNGDESLTKHGSAKVWLWTFGEVEGVDPTNNAAERALRPAVIWRKLSFGTQSSTGSRFVETLLVVVETCRQQQRNVLAHVTHALTALFHNEPAPSLLPRALPPGRAAFRELAQASSHRPVSWSRL